MVWYICGSSSKFSASITASLHTEHVNTPEKMQEFADKLTRQSMMFKITINCLWFRVVSKEIGTTPLSTEQGTQQHSASTPSSYEPVAHGYTDEMKQRLWNGMPQRSYTEAKAKQAKLVDRPKPTFKIDKDSEFYKQSAKFWHMQIEFRDSRVIPGIWTPWRDLCI